MSINKRLVLFSLLLLISFALSSNFIGNPPSMLLFENTNAQTSINSTATGSQNQASEEVFIVQNTSMSVPATVSHHGQPLH